MEEILPVLMSATEKIGSFAEILQGVASVLSGLEGNVNAMLGSAAKGISEATQVIVGGFSQVRASIAPFVAALNPSIMFGLDQAFKSLQATIGVALVPVAQVLTTALREVAGELMESMGELAPVLETIAQAVKNLVLPPFMLLAEGIKAFAPVLSFLASGVKIVTNALSGLAVVGRTLFQFIGAWISSLFGSGTNDALAGFRTALQTMVRALIQAVAYISKAFGSLAFISRLQENLEKMAKPSAKMGAPPAATDVGTKGFEDIAKTMAVAAFSAQGGGAPSKSENEWLGDIAKSLDDVKKDNRSLGEVIADGAWKALDKTWERFVEWHRRTVLGRAVHWVDGTARDVADTVGGWFR